MYTRRIVGTYNGHRYTLSEPSVMFAPAYKYQVGADYPLIKLKTGDKRVDLEVLDKRGKPEKRTLTLLSEEEIEK